MESFLNIPSSSFTFCVQSLANTSRVTRESNILSFLLGDGRQLDEIESSLKESIHHYNENFKRLQIFDDQIITFFKNLENDIDQLAAIELTLQDQLTEMSRFSHLNTVKFDYLLTKMQHENALHRLLTESKFLDNLALLQRGLFGSNLCSLVLCESGISIETSKSKVLVHREILELHPIQLYLITCQAPFIGMLPKIHNTLAERTVSGSFLVEKQLSTPESL